MAYRVVGPTDTIMTIFWNGQTIVVITHGPGKLHLYSYGSNSGLPGVFGTTATSKSGTSHFVISHSYTYTKYAFFWDGKGRAEYCVGESKQWHPVGHSWGTSSWLGWGANTVTTLDVSPEYFVGAVNRNNEVTCFLLPEGLQT